MAGATAEDRNSAAFVNSAIEAEAARQAGVLPDPDFMEAGKQVVADKIAAYKAGNKDFILSDSPSWVGVGMAAMFGDPAAVDVATLEIGKYEDEELIKAGFEAEHNY